MSTQILHLRNRIIHVPSVASFRLGSTFLLNRPALIIRYHDGSEDYLVYAMSMLAGWPDAKEDARRLQVSMDAIRDALSGIPMYEEVKKVQVQELK